MVAVDGAPLAHIMISAVLSAVRPVRARRWWSPTAGIPDPVADMIAAVSENHTAALWPGAIFLQGRRSRRDAPQPRRSRRWRMMSIHTCWALLARRPISRPKRAVDLPQCTTSRAWNRTWPRPDRNYVRHARRVGSLVSLMNTWWLLLIRPCHNGFADSNGQRSAIDSPKSWAGEAARTVQDVSADRGAVPLQRSLW